jgi:redox-sensitive bicupin YhaK (pirin superfamily)
MIEVRPISGLGAADHGWLDARHHFSFADYHDPERTNWGQLRVWNDDTIAPRSGFPPHPHRDMEIITYVRKGAITHRDSLGNRPHRSGRCSGHVRGQRSEAFRVQLEDVTTQIFQIWLIPDERGGEPSWGARPFPKEARDGQFVPLASGMKGDDALPIRAEARVLGATVKAGETVTYEASPDRHLYLVPATGKVRIGEAEVSARDGAAITDLSRIDVTALKDAELVLVDAR